jgi:hypothetical protein
MGVPLSPRRSRTGADAHAVICNVTRAALMAQIARPLRRLASGAVVLTDGVALVRSSGRPPVAARLRVGIIAGMRVAALYDIHGNSVALRVVLAELERQGGRSHRCRR